MSCPPLKTNIQAFTANPLILVIMDGVGIGRGDAADAVACAHTPHLNRLSHLPLTTKLLAHGQAVGMPQDSDMGNSEVGHNAMGAGRIFDQGAKLVAAAIASGALFRGTTWQRLIGHCVHNKTALHFLGLVSDGNVHSHIDHLLAMLSQAASHGVERAYVHALLDGRDVSSTSALHYIEQLETHLASIRATSTATAPRDYRIASGGGRMHITMDRYEADWPMVERGWHAHVLGQARMFESATAAIETMRREHAGIGDQDLPAFVIADNQQPRGRMTKGDAVIAFNFRGDRMLEMCQAFEDETFDKFARGAKPELLFCGMVCYDGDTQRPKHFLVEAPPITCTLSELLCQAHVTQLACSETQKFGHVTYFWNGNKSGMFDSKLEQYIEVPSLPPPFDKNPAMRALEITQTVLKTLSQGQTRFARLNLANGDMIGHTGHFLATVAAMQTVDTCIGLLDDYVQRTGGILIVTADHGNAEDMAERDFKTGLPLYDKQGRMVPKTSHSLNLVPFYVSCQRSYFSHMQLAKLEHPGLGNLAATIARLLGFKSPEGFLPSLIDIHSKSL